MARPIGYRTFVAYSMISTNSRTQFKEATKKAMDWIEENEPDTLQFEMYEEESPEGIKICLFER